jgi:DNA polymerase-3 subunit alpha
LRDAGRVLGMGYGQVDKIAKLIPTIPTDPITLDDALGRGKRPDRVIAEFRDLYETDDEARELVDLALSIEDLVRNAGKHAGGVVIAPSALTDFAPLYCEGSGDGVVTQFDKDDVESVGLVKFDFLGLRTLTIIDWAVKAINLRRTEAGEPALDIATLPLDDARVFALFQNARTVAVFQFEGNGMQRMLVKAKPDRFDDLMALTSLFRPGPMEQIDSFCRRKNGEERIDYADPRVEPVLRETYGIMVYQEQVMQMAQIVGGYSLGGADLLRRAMGKKIAAEMAKHRVVFGEGAAKNGVAGDKADAIFDLMEKFAGYGFNKSHAAAYALVSYQTAWLKTHYPAEFMAAVLSSDMDNTDKVVTFLAEARTLGLTVQPPDVNASTYMFEATDAKTIRYGLGAVKGVGRNAVENLVQARTRGGAFAELADFCQRVDGQKVNKRVLEALILSGAMDALGANRASLIVQLPECLRAAEQAARDAEAGQNDMFGAASATPAPRFKLTNVPEWPPEQRLAGERDTLGHYLSGHPTLLWRDTLAQLATCPIGEIGQRYQPPKPRADDDGNRFRRPPETPWVVAGQLVDLRKRGNDQAFVQIEDWSGRIEVSLFREAFVEFAPLLTRDAILVIEGGLAWDDFAGALRIRARRVLTLNEACERHAKLLRIRLNGGGADALPALRDILIGYRGGQTPLRVQYANDSGSVELELGADWRVRATADLKRSLDGLPGVKSTEWVLGRSSGS